MRPTGRPPSPVPGTAPKAVSRSSAVTRRPWPCRRPALSLGSGWPATLLTIGHHAKEHAVRPGDRCGRSRPGRRGRVLVVAVGAALLAPACTSGGATAPTSPTAGSSTQGSTSPAASPSGRGTIAQPRLDRLNRRTRRRLAPEGRRIDLAVPTFSHPSDVTNPL